MSGPDYLLAIDQGTTSTRAILFDPSGAVLHTARRELRQIYPRPGWVEHDPEEIWQAVVATCREAIASAKGRAIAAIGITNQRETTLLWDRATGHPVHNAIVWQDRRTAELCESWRAAARNGRHQRLAHDAVRSAAPRLGRRAAPRLRHPARAAARVARQRRRL